MTPKKNHHPLKKFLRKNLSQNRWKKTTAPNLRNRLMSKSNRRTQTPSKLENQRRLPQKTAEMPKQNRTLPMSPLEKMAPPTLKSRQFRRTLQSRNP